MKTIVSTLLVTAALCALVLSLSGCGMSRGWRVSFGVAPVASLDDRQGLKQGGKDEN